MKLETIFYKTTIIKNKKHCASFNPDENDAVFF